MTDDAPKRPRGRPRIHADSKAAASARAVAHRRAKRAGLHERVVHLDDETSARADALMQARGSRSFSALVTTLVAEAALPGDSGLDGLRARAARADVPAALAVLERVPDVEPEAGDALPGRE